MRDDWQAAFEERFTAYGWPDPASAARVAVEVVKAVSPGCRGAELALEQIEQVIASRRDSTEVLAVVVDIVREALAAFRASGEAGPE